MSYASGCDGDEHSECFYLDCPSSHPVKMPEIDLYVRVLGYEGGAHVFSDGSDVSMKVLYQVFIFFQSIYSKPDNGHLYRVQVYSLSKEINIVFVDFP